MTLPTLLRKLRREERLWRNEARAKDLPETWFHHAHGRARAFAEVIGWLTTRPVKARKKP